MTKVVSGLDLRRRRRPDATAGTSTDPTDAVAVRLALGAALRRLPRRCSHSPYRSRGEASVTVTVG